MNKVKKIVILNMISNLVISIIKIVSGFVFKINSLFVDGLHTLTDFITDIISLISIKIEKKRPTKLHPFGFGKVQYLTNLFIGIIMLLLSFYIVYHSFTSQNEIPPFYVLYIVFISFILKLFFILNTKRCAKKYKSQILFTSYMESITDLVSTFLVFFVVILLQFSEEIKFLQYSDLLASLFIFLFIFKNAIKIISTNSLLLIGEAEFDEEIHNKIDEVLDSFKVIEHSDYQLLKNGDYYILNLKVVINKNLNVVSISNLEKRIKKEIRKKRLQIKFITIIIHK
ncbi:MAG: cation diffusion facilitator family transporter [Mycoplasmatota bacterium]